MLAFMQTVSARIGSVAVTCSETQGVTKQRPLAVEAVDLPPSTEKPEMEDGAPMGSLPQQIREALQAIEDGSTAQLLGELVAIAGQISSVDLVLKDTATEGPFPGSEAEKWHEVAFRTAEWTRKALVQRQQQCLEQLLNRVQVAKQGQGVEAPTLTRKLPPPTDCPCAPPGLDGPQCGGGSVGEDCLFPEGSMRKGLEALHGYEAGRVLIVRKIKKLGFEAPMRLKEHFSEFGAVTGVHIANSTMKPSAKRPGGRVRPGALGFLVMETVESAKAVLAGGADHIVCDVPISVKEFEPFVEGADQEE